MQRGGRRVVAITETEQAARDVVSAFARHLRAGEELQLLGADGGVVVSSRPGAGAGIELCAICAKARARLAVRCSCCRDWRLPFCMGCATKGGHADRFFEHRRTCDAEALGLREVLP